MGEEKKQSGSTAPGDPVDIPSLVRHVLEEFVRTEHTKTEPAYKAELQDERKRREQLERRLNELVEENKRSQKMAEEADRNASIRAELQRLGVGKVDLAFKAVKDDIARTGDGRLIGKSDTGEVSMKEFLAGFVNANPEFLPARISGGSGIPSTQKSTPAGTAPIDIEKIGPGMTADEREQARLEIARIASQALRGT